MTLLMIGYCVAIAICVSWSFSGWDKCGFVYDDGASIVGNADVTRNYTKEANDTSAWVLLKHDFWGQDITHNNSHKSFRPLTVLTFRMSHDAHGLWATGFHAVDIVLHGLVCVAILFVFSGALQSLGVDKKEAVFTAGAASVLFASHPVHAEAVVNITSRCELLCALFYLLGFEAYRRHLHARSFRVSCAWFAAATLLYALAILAKETGITLPGVLVCFHLLWWARGSYSSDASTTTTIADDGEKDANNHNHLNSSSSNNNHSSNSNNKAASKGQTKQQSAHTNGTAHTASKKPNHHHHTTTTTTSIAAAASGIIVRCLVWIFGVILPYLWYRRAISGASMTPIITRTDNMMATHPSFLARTLSFAHIHARYMQLLVMPYNLSCDYSFNAIPFVVDVADARNCLTLLCYGSFVGLALWGMKTRSWATLMALSWIIIPFVTASNVLVYIATVIGERLLYLPSVGFCLVVAHALASVAFRRNGKLAAWIVLVVVVACYADRTRTRVRDWESKLTLVTNDIKLYPNSARLQRMMGSELIKTERKQDGLAPLRRALEIDPEMQDARVELATTLEELGDLDGAEAEYRVLLTQDPTRYSYHNPFAFLLLKRQKLDEAVQEFVKCITLKAEWGADIASNIGNIKVLQRRGLEAMRFYQLSLRLDGESSSARFNVAIFLHKLGRVKDAWYQAKRAADLDPNDADARNMEQKLYEYLKAVAMQSRQTQQQQQARSQQQQQQQHQQRPRQQPQPHKFQQPI